MFCGGDWMESLALKTPGDESGKLFICSLSSSAFLTYVSTVKGNLSHFPTGLQTPEGWRPGLRFILFCHFPNTAIPAQLLDKQPNVWLVIHCGFSRKFRGNGEELKMQRN